MRGFKLPSWDEVVIVLSFWLLGCGGRAGPGGVGWVPPEDEKPKWDPPSTDPEIEARLKALHDFMNLVLFGTYDQEQVISERVISTHDVSVAFLGLDFEMVVQINIMARRATGGTLVSDSVLISVVTGEVVGWIRTLTAGVKIGAPAASGSGGVLATMAATLAPVLAVYGIIKGLEALGIGVPTSRYDPVISDVTGRALAAENIMHIAYTDRELANIDAVIKGAKGPIDVGPSRSATQAAGIIRELRRMASPDIRADRNKDIWPQPGGYGNPDAQSASVQRLASLGFTEKNIRTTLNLSKHAYYDFKHYDNAWPATSVAGNPYDEDE